MSMNTEDPGSERERRVSAIGLEPKQSNGMQYRRVGRSGLTVSAIGVGCFAFGGFLELKAAQAVIDCALDLGINYFDTSDSYGIGTSEACLGQILVGKRHQAVIATKFGNRTDDGPNDTGASRQHIVAACEASLKRLRTDYIDLYQVHWPDRQTPIGETLRALDDLVRAGKVRYLGVSNFYAWEICEALMIADKYGLTPFISSQDFYNLLYRDVEKRMEPFFVKFGIGRNSYFPLAGGLLALAYRRGGPVLPDTRQASSAATPSWQTERNWNMQEALLAFAQARGWTLPQMALAWMLSRPAMATTIAGADKPEHLRANIRALEVSFTPEDLIEIDRITLIDEDRSVAPVYRTLRPEKVHEFEAMQLARTRR